MEKQNNGNPRALLMLGLSAGMVFPVPNQAFVTFKSIKKPWILGAFLPVEDFAGTGRFSTNLAIFLLSSVACPLPIQLFAFAMHKHPVSDVSLLHYPCPQPRHKSPQRNYLVIGYFFHGFSMLFRSKPTGQAGGKETSIQLT